jgi:membrane protein implicated in regulation of membrane protease activity
MTWPADPLTATFLSMFLFGLIFSVASLLLGAGHEHVHLPGGEGAGHGHGHAGHHGIGGHAAGGAPGVGATHVHGDGGAADVPDPRAGVPSPINLSTIMIFITWFGGVGFLLRSYYAAPAALSLAGGAFLGLVGAVIVYLFMAKLLWRWQNELDPAAYYLEGVVARVSSPIRAGGTGEIVYTLDQKRRVDGARSVDGEQIPVGSEVEIVRYEGGLAYVRPGAGAASDGPFRGQPVEPLSLPPPK